MEYPNNVKQALNSNIGKGVKTLEGTMGKAKAMSSSVDAGAGKITLTNTKAPCGAKGKC